MNAKDLLDFDKMQELNTYTELAKKFAIDEIKRTAYFGDNFSALNQLDQEGSLKDYNQEANETNNTEETE
jgi:hypothetical protein